MFSDRGRNIRLPKPKKLGGLRHRTSPDTTSYQDGYYRIIVTHSDGSDGYAFEDVRPYLVGKKMEIYSSLPQWKDIVREGGDATTPFDAWSKKVSVDPYSLTAVSTTSWGRVDTEHQFCSAPFLHPTRDTVDLDVVTESDQTALMQAISRLKPQFAAYTFLGEAKKTLRLMKSPVQALRRGVNSYLENTNKIRRKTRNVKHFRKAVADSWLEYSFGWTPLINDVKSGAEAFAQLAERPRYRSFIGQHTAKGSKPLQIVTITGTGLIQEIYSESTSTVSTRYSGKIALSMTTNSLYQGFGLEWQEFIPAAWELAPWSFLIDYFTNAGDIIDSAIRIKTTNFRYCMYQQRRELKYREVWKLRPHSFALDSLSYTPGQVVTDLKSYTRSSSSSLPMPQFQCGFDGFSFKRGLNIGALVTGSALDSNYRRRGY